MKYYYGNLIIQLITAIVILIIIVRTIINLENKKIHKAYWILIIILIPLLISCVNTHLIIPAKDLKYAIKGETKDIQGTVQKVYMSGGINSFILDGKEFRRNPWQFKPKKGEKYILIYLPNSGFVVEYKKIDK